MTLTFLIYPSFFSNSIQCTFSSCFFFLFTLSFLSCSFRSAPYLFCWGCCVIIIMKTKKCLFPTLNLCFSSSLFSEYNKHTHTYIKTEKTPSRREIREHPQVKCIFVVWLCNTSNYNVRQNGVLFFLAFVGICVVTTYKKTKTRRHLTIYINIRTGSAFWLCV